MRCPVCKSDCATDDKECNVCGFPDIGVEFLNHTDIEEWKLKTVEPCRAIWKKAISNHLVAKPVSAERLYNEDVDGDGFASEKIDQHISETKSDYLGNLSIDDFDFSNRVYNRLVKEDVYHISDLEGKTAADLGLPSESSYIGAEEFAARLGIHGFRLKNNRQNPDDVMAVMLGHAIGDAMGVPVEFVSRERLSVHPVTGFKGYGAHQVPAGTWSDDTSMSLATLDSLARGLDYTDIMRRFCDWKTNAAYTATGEVFDIGSTTDEALCRFQRGGNPLTCGSTGEHDNGNGSLMRIIPAVLYCSGLYSDTTMEERLEIVHSISALTHAHPRSKMGCGIYAIVMWKLLTSKKKIAIKNGLAIAENYYKSRPEFANELPHYTRLFDKRFQSILESEIKSSGYVVDTLEAAIWSVLNTENYAECVLKAVNLGEDTDTVAAVAGGLAAAMYGLQGIPRKWKEELRKKEQLESICRDFVDAQNATPSLIFDESRISVHMERQRQIQRKKRYREINRFAGRMIDEFQNKDANEHDQVFRATFFAVCMAFGFTADMESLGSAYRKAFGDDKLALRDAHAFSRAACKITDVDTLASVIFAKWRHITHWSSESLLSKENRPWFVAAFERLREITSDPPIDREPFHYLVDVHGHYVCGMDDGATDIEMSVAMVRKAYTQGVRDIICTSHSWGNNKKYLYGLAQLQLMLAKEKIDVRIYSGTEIACTRRTMPVIVEQLNDGQFRPIGKSSYVLLEFDPNVRSSEIKSCIKYMNSCKFKPVIAHAERYFSLLADKDTLDVLRAHNVPLQINAYSLVEEKNDEIRNFARELLLEKRVTFVGSDAHQLNHRPPSVKSGIDYIYKHCDQSYADEICYKNAERLLLGK